LEQVKKKSEFKIEIFGSGGISEGDNWQKGPFGIDVRSA